ncbi:hypothetical protein EVAR_17726_1 [Eumeta japonica]|uniref:Uncharacterized protein n=1 Tax=Eumeta variegata TaxID=151549 RepID=A0A4C1TTT6_EUMVA|nr:hypothetical protein EVAR_17726_1 [Eumeta japonica]
MVDLAGQPQNYPLQLTQLENIVPQTFKLFDTERISWISVYHYSIFMVANKSASHRCPWTRATLYRRVINALSAFKEARLFFLKTLLS